MSHIFWDTLYLYLIKHVLCLFRQLHGGPKVLSLLIKLFVQQWQTLLTIEVSKHLVTIKLSLCAAAKKQVYLVCDCTLFDG